VAAVLLLPGVAFLAASGTGIVAPGIPFPLPTDGNGRRQLVELRRVGTVLRGVPSAGALAMITLRTRVAVDAASVVLWERHTESGTALLHITAPSWLEKNLLGATLFFWSPPDTANVAQANAGRWIDLEPVIMPAGTRATSGPPSPTLTAYPVAELGFFALNPLVASGARLYPRPDATDFDPRTRIARAGWHLIWPAALLILSMLVSKRHHAQGTL
jgi:hypothetical protein